MAICSWARIWSKRLLRRNGAGQDADQGARDLDADGADHDALDPLLGGERRVRLDRGDLPEERADKGKRADRSDERLADMGPGEDQVGDWGQTRQTLRKQHVKPPGFWTWRL